LLAAGSFGPIIKRDNISGGHVGSTPVPDDRRRRRRRSLLSEEEEVAVWLLKFPVLKRCSELR
jgi:hypothetical protein